MSQPVWCVNSESFVMFLSVASAVALSPEPIEVYSKFTQPITAYSKRIISPIPWCHCKATEALAHGDPPSPLPAPPHPSPQSQWCRPSRSGNHFTGSKHFPLRPAMIGASAHAQFQSLAVWVAEELTHWPQETQEATWCEQRCHRKPSSHLFLEITILSCSISQIRQPHIPADYCTHLLP